jgi:hypothetical protein
MFSRPLSMANAWSDADQDSPLGHVCYPHAIQLLLDDPVTSSVI